MVEVITALLALVLVCAIPGTFVLFAYRKTRPAGLALLLAMLLAVMLGVGLWMFAQREHAKSVRESQAQLGVQQDALYKLEQSLKNREAELARQEAILSERQKSFRKRQWLETDVLFPTFESPDVEEVEYRNWTSMNGHQVEAAFCGMAFGKVKLRRKDNGEVIELLVDRLSPEDRLWIELRKK